MEYTQEQLGNVYKCEKYFAANVILIATTDGASGSGTRNPRVGGDCLLVPAEVKYRTRHRPAKPDRAQTTVASFNDRVERSAG